ncbi:MAG: phosphohistidine phosphatase SixA [Thermodesulfobacteriota bacterium]
MSKKMGGMPMALYLVQHGKNLPKEEDPEQSLSNQGRSDAERMAEVARNYSVQVGKILYSEKKRARETAEIMAKYLDPQQGVQEAAGLKALDEVAPWVEKVQDMQNVMLVGHLPFMQKLLAYLVAGDEQKQILKFQNAGIVCLDQEEDGTWYIKWTLMPNIQ